MLTVRTKGQSLVHMHKYATLIPFIYFGMQLPSSIYLTSATQKTLINKCQIKTGNPLSSCYCQYALI